MLKKTLALLLLVTCAGYSAASSDYGIVTDLTHDTITIQQWDQAIVTYKASIELLTNTISTAGCSALGSDKFVAVKKGDKLCLESYKDGADFICCSIRLHRPNDMGIVTEVGKDSITIRSDKGKTITYKVRKDVIANGRPDGPDAILYPSAFSDVTPGCRIEVAGYLDHGEFVLWGLDVKEQKERAK